MGMDAAFVEAGAGVSAVQARWRAFAFAAPGFVLDAGPAAAGGEDAVFVRDCAQNGLVLAELARLAAVDPTTLGGGDRVDLVRALERARAMVDGLQQHALAAVWAATTACGLDGEAARHEVAAALRLSAPTAAARVGVAAALVTRLPATLGALCAGDLGYLHARHLADAVSALPDGVATAVETAVLPEAPGQSLGELRQAVTRAVLAADPAGAAERADTAAARRAITRHRAPEAMEGWWVTMPASFAADAWEALTRQARTTQALLREQRGIDPGLDALRVDTLVSAVLGEQANRGSGDSIGDTAHGGSAAGGSGGPQPPPVPRCRCGGAQTAAVVIDLPTLLGLAENPGEVPGYGPVPASVARELAADRDWERWTTHPHTRALLDRSPLTYRPGRRLRGFVAAANRTCGFPGCARPAENTDLDHRITHRHGGRTTVINLGPLCRTHHNAKTHGRWRITYHPHNDAWTWTSPLGKTYRAQHHPPLRT